MSVFLFSTLSIILVLFLTVVSFFMSEASLTSREESSTYECGFEHYSYSRLPFSIRYFLLTVIFLVFDMEIMFLLFIPSSYFESLGLGLYLSLIMLFILILIMGLIYEWVDGSLNWVM